MPITSSAKKANRSSLLKRRFNDRRTRAMRTEVKSIRKLVAGGSAKEGQAKLSDAYQAIDKAAKRGVIKKNTAARYKSRLSKLLRKNS